MKKNRLSQPLRQTHFILGLGRELVGTLFRWCLILVLAVPTRFAFAETPPPLPPPPPPPANAAMLQAANDQGHDPVVEQIGRLMGLSGDERNKLAESIQIELQSENVQVMSELESLYHKAQDEKQVADPQKVQALVARQKLYQEHKKALLDVIGAENETMVGVLDMGKTSESADPNVISAEMTVEKGKDQLGEAEAPARLHERLISAAAHGTAHFTTQYISFSMAMGIIALSQIGVQSSLQAVGLGQGAQTDPNAFENWEKQTFNLLGAEGFAFFMLGSHSTIELLKNLHFGFGHGDIPAHLMPTYLNFLGMTAGSVAQSLFMDLHNDKDVWACVRPYYDSSLKPNPQACEQMRANWITKGKILQYTPSILSMLGSTAISSAIQSSLSTVANSESIVANGENGLGRIAHIKFKGASLVEKSRVGRVIAKGMRFFPVKLVGLGDFVMFLLVDTYVTQEPINQGWQNLRSHYVDINAWLNKSANLHAEFFWPKEGSIQAIANAFDVEATNPYTAHLYYMDMLKKMQETGWKKPAGPETCVPKSVIEAAKEDDINNHWLPARWWMQSERRKSQQQLSCEVLSRPADLLTRYGEVGREWRGVVMSPFSSAQNNWITMLSQFTSIYGSSMKLAGYLAEQKFNAVYKQAKDKPDLSREALAKIIGVPLAGAKNAPAEAEGEQKDKGNSMFLDNTWMPTPEVIDFVVAGFSCGPDVKLDPSKVSVLPIPQWFDALYSAAARNITSPSYMTTPWGSSLHFVPPKLTNKGRALCENVPNSLFDTVNIMTGGWLPSLYEPKVLNPFTGPFVDEDKKSYDTMADYLFDNLDPEIYKPMGAYSGFPTWWSNHMTKPITPVYQKYADVYNNLITAKYLPLLFDRTYKFGCRQAESVVTMTDDYGRTTTVSGADKPDDCTNSSNAYRVGNGFFLAVEIELRNYIRGLYSLYVSTLPTSANAATAPAKKADNAKAVQTTAPGTTDASADKKKAFMDIANRLIKDLQANSGEELRGADLEQRLTDAGDATKQLHDLVDAQLKDKPTADSAFQTEILGKFNDQITQLIGEEHGQLDMVRMWNFSGATSGGPVKRVDTPTNANPLQRGGE